jgi:hypothetical protein
LLVVSPPYPTPPSVILTGVVLLIPPAGTVIVADAAIIGVIPFGRV